MIQTVFQKGFENDFEIKENKIKREILYSFWPEWRFPSAGPSGLAAAAACCASPAS
jgi:hypothetical protein